jgi:hypothetical protein
MVGSEQLQKGLTFNRIINKTYARLIAIALIILIGFGGWKIYSLTQNNKISLDPYVVSKYNFTIGFPSVPIVDNLSKKILGNLGTGAAYASYAHNTNQQYVVDVFTIPSSVNLNTFSDQKLIELLTIEEEAVVTLSMKASDINTSQTTYLGRPAAQVQFKASNSGSTQTGYIRGFFNGQNYYIIYTLGASKSNFNIFANSFRFNQ